MSHRFREAAAAVLLLVSVVSTAGAATPESDTAPAEQTVAAEATGPVEAPEPRAKLLKPGPVTGLPMPRYVSMKASVANARRGPSMTHRIDWVYQRRDMPLEIVAEYGHWRRIQDRDGLGGWVHYSLLSGTRTAIVTQPMLDLHFRPDTASPVTARLETGVVARLGECGRDWCRLSAGGYRGWAPKTALWGVGRDEIRD